MEDCPPVESLRHLERFDVSVLRPIDEELLEKAAKGELHKPFRDSLGASAPRVPAAMRSTDSAALTSSQQEWLEKKRQTVFACAPLHSSESRCVARAAASGALKDDEQEEEEENEEEQEDEDEEDDEDEEEDEEEEERRETGRQGAHESLSKQAEDLDEAADTELSPVGHLVAAYRLILQWERGEGAIKVEEEKDQRPVSVRLRQSLCGMARAGKHKVGQALTYMTTATVSKQCKDPFVLPAVPFDDEWRYAQAAIGGKLHLLWVPKKSSASPPPAYHLAYARILEKDGRFLMFPSKQAFLAKARACLVLPLRRSRFSFFSAPSDGRAGADAAARGNALRVQDFDGAGEGVRVVLYFKFRQATSRDLWLAALKRARAKAQKAGVDQGELAREEAATDELAVGTERTKGVKTNLQALLDRNADVNVQGSNGLTCLHLAALNGSLPSLLELLRVKRLLLEARTHSGLTALNVAVQQGKQEVVSALLKAGAQDVRFLL